MVVQTQKKKTIFVKLKVMDSDPSTWGFLIIVKQNSSIVELFMHQIERKMSLDYYEVG